MSGEHLEKRIPLYFYDELTEAERKELEVHLEYCESCRQQFEEVQSLHKVLDKRAVLEPNSDILERSRLMLRERLREERREAMKEPWWQRLIGHLSLQPHIGLQLAGAVFILILGVFLGKFFWTGTKQQFVPEIARTTRIGEMDESLIANIDFIEYNPTSGTVTVKYKRVNDMFVQGQIDDPPIRKLLTHAIRSESHPGRRLTAVKALGEHAFSDHEVEDVLVYAMEYDAVDGVRLKAAKVLKTLPITPKIKQAFIRVLLKDANPAIRIEAVEALSQAADEDVLNVFQDASQDDENEFIRLKAAKELERREEGRIERVEQPQVEEELQN
ncbi:hypothetical protein GWO43_22330 [candidate division KSB1 bacterium]|nr:hypothetical protein [candidate division KSB1 bacterium]NIR72638.1 hypothetical protein [candidate division KSB1 bacterium]NIS27349.1 hypothetical protein [candidate division KSB1 bacterium]NIT73562.1 hypothetical protein [candidate division KSB1 bacterium]NIU25410.1 hypothetical protein [candidate division KSB1 bacterium]